jgi:hypothetical protein
MELERDMLASPAGEVPVIEGELVTAIRTLADRGCRANESRERSASAEGRRRDLQDFRRTAGNRRPRETACARRRARRSSPAESVSSRPPYSA